MQQRILKVLLNAILPPESCSLAVGAGLDQAITWSTHNSNGRESGKGLSANVSFSSLWNYWIDIKQYN